MWIFDNGKRARTEKQAKKIAKEMKTGEVAYSVKGKKPFYENINTIWDL